jgi:hypothetical protein
VIVWSADRVIRTPDRIYVVNGKTSMRS